MVQRHPKIFGFVSFFVALNIPVLFFLYKANRTIKKVHGLVLLFQNVLLKALVTMW